MRLAAIDLGSNSVHMVVADVSSDGRIQVVDRVKEMVRLGRHAFLSGRLTPESMDLAVRAVDTFRRIAVARKVERLRAVATSAVREARNGAAFIRRLRREAGVTVRVISGPEEARLIFRAARHALGLDGGPHLLVDVGGGSVELVLVRDGRALWMRSLPLGAARLAERFLTSDPPTVGQVKRLEKHLDREIGDLLDDARRAGVARAVGTSGTINTLVAMARAARGEEVGRLHGARASAAEVAQLRRRLVGNAAQARAELPGIDSKRVDLMPAAAVLVDAVLTRAGAPELVACTWALREGVLLELAGIDGRRGAVTTDARRRSVEALAERFLGANVHGRQVAKLATTLFDATASALALPASARELLEYAALLHDIGHVVEHDRHHRQSCYLIRNAELLGFDPIEIECIAQVARGHRKQSPKMTDPELRALPASARRTVRALAALLRVGDALDRTHFGVIRSLRTSHQDGHLVIEVDVGRDNAELELWAAERRADLLARLLDLPVAVRVRPPGRRTAPVPSSVRSGARARRA